MYAGRLGTHNGGQGNAQGGGFFVAELVRCADLDITLNYNVVGERSILMLSLVSAEWPSARGFTEKYSR